MLLLHLPLLLLLLLLKEQQLKELLLLLLLVRVIRPCKCASGMFGHVWA
jgi:hypothetical protein